MNYQLNLLSVGIGIFFLFGCAEKKVNLFVSPEYNELLNQITNYINEGNYPLAKTKIDAALKIDKNNQEIWVAYGRIYLAENKFKKALKMCDKALKINPQYHPAYFWRGKIYLEWNKPLEAKNDFKAALIANPDYQPAKDAWEKLNSSK